MAHWTIIPLVRDVCRSKINFVVLQVVVLYVAESVTSLFRPWWAQRRNHDPSEITTSHSSTQFNMSLKNSNEMLVIDIKNCLKPRSPNFRCTHLNQSLSVGPVLQILTRNSQTSIFNRWSYSWLSRTMTVVSAKKFVTL